MNRWATLTKSLRDERPVLVVFQQPAKAGAEAKVESQSRRLFFHPAGVACLAVSDILSRIKAAARELGFDVVGIASVEPLHADDAHYRRWLDSGFAAGMDYMTRRPDLFASPGRLVPDAQSLITLAVNYYASAPEFQHQNRYGRVARYAWGLDYHEVVKPRLARLAARIEDLAGRKVHARCFVDAVPLLERAVAESAGLGFVGKNTNLLQPRSGSWFFLAEILVDLELAPDTKRISVSCGSCRRCIEACPTGAFAEEYVLDSRRCISYLTIENKGEIPRELRDGVGEWLFGCDVCQDVCPFNRFASDTDWPHLRPEAGTGQKLDLVEVLSISNDAEFRARFGGTALSRPKRRGLLRNAAVVAANVECTSTVPLLADRVGRDPEALIRAHALWALGRLDFSRARRLAERLRLDDPEQLVRNEALAVLSDE